MPSNRTVWSIYESIRSAIVMDPDKPRGPKRHLTNTGVNIRPMHTSHLVHSTGPLVSVVTLHG